MISQKNVDVLLEAMRRAGAGELDDLAELMDSAGVMTGMKDWPEQGPFIGRGGVIDQFKRIRADWVEQRFADTVIVAHEGDWVVIEYRWHVQAENGLEADFDLALATKFKDGRIREIHYRWDRDQALNAAGLSERSEIG